LRERIEDAVKCAKTPLCCQFAITGRINSTFLDRILQGDSALPGTTLYVTNSTAPSLRENVKLEYVIGDDNNLAVCLADEIRLRQVSLNIALIAEWDTDYGREMFKVFQAVCESPNRSNVHYYSYLRGLDGKLPGMASQTSDGGKPAGGGDGGAPNRLATSKEAEGDPQIDYLRRLVDRMKADSQEFRAVGVLGSDVYDKLLLLKALRPHFPHAVFFTTDLDVRLLQPGDYDDVRNLLIASHFGLCLKNEFQGKIAPFRSSYDTASYLGVLRAVNYPNLSHATWSLNTADLPVHLYEVGRSGAYELALPKAGYDPIGATHLRLDTWRMTTFLALVALLLVALLLYPVSRPWRELLWADLTNLNRFQTVTLIAVALGFVLAALMIVSHLTPGNEPVEVFEGLSVWPTVVLRFLAAVFALYAIMKALTDLANRNKMIRSKFFLAGREKPTAPTAWYQGWWDSLRDSWQVLYWDPKEPVTKDTLWKEFEEHEHGGRRFWRCVQLSSLYLLLLFLLWQLFDHVILQARGPIAWYTNFIVLILTGAALVGLLMFVVDCTLVSYRLVILLSRFAGTWPEELLAQQSQRKGLRLVGAHGNDARDSLGQWLHLRLIDEATIVVAHLIYSPFVVLLMLIVAQNRLFDDWHWNIPLILVALLSAGTALVCALLLQRAAKRTKEQALEKLGVIVRRWVGCDESGFREKVERLRKDVEEIHTGAFAGFLYNPVMRALLLPVAGGGGLASLEALLRYF
jgi:hypothetical protein